MILAFSTHIHAMVVSALAVVPPPPLTVVSGGPYCGVYCVYAATRACGYPAKFEDLLDQRYVGSYKGSTITELQQAAARLGLHGTPMSGLTPAALKQSPHPVILHVRRPGHKMPYAHWVLFAGVQDGKARIVDPPTGVELIPFSELCALWDGVGLVVSDGPPDSNSLKFAAWIDSGVIVAFVGLALVVLRIGKYGRGLRPVSSACALVLIGGVVGLTSQSIGSGGLYSDRHAASLVAGQYFLPTIPEISLDEARLLVGSPGVTVVDARSTADFAAAHIPGAISLPVFAGLSERRAVSAALAEGSRVIVYCQSRDCAWSDSVAADLYHRGHVNVCIFRGGWQEWSHAEE